MVMKWTQRHPSILLGLALLALTGLTVACSSDSPSEPRQDPPPPPGVGGGGGFNVTVTVTPPSAQVTSTNPIEVLVTVRSRDTGAPPADGSTVQVTGTLGSFNAVGGPTDVTVPLVNGEARLLFFPGDVPGTAVIQATFQGTIGQALLALQDVGAFFLSFIDPNVGQAGEVVTIHGSGFVVPARVLFGGVSARVLSVTPSRIRVEVPLPPSPIPRNTTLPVTVEVTIRVGTPNAANDSLTQGFIFQPGSSSVPQPIIFSVDPPGGPNEGGTRLTVLGDNFEAPVRVVFTGGGGSSEGTVESVIQTRIVVRTPPATALGVDNRGNVVNVTVINLDSGFENTLDNAFQYGFIPFFIDTIVPGRGPQAGGTTATIRGTGFSDPVRVLIGTFVAAVDSVSPDTIVIRTPAITDDVLLTEVCNDNGDAQDGMRFIPTAFDVTVTDITSGESDTLQNGFIYDPTDVSCRNDVAPPPPPPPPPQAAFSFSVSGLDVIFTNESVDFSTSAWDFGDGTVSSVTNPVHTYAVADTYVVTLVVRNSIGQTDSVSQFVTVP